MDPRVPIPELTDDRRANAIASSAAGIIAAAESLSGSPVGTTPIVRIYVRKGSDDDQRRISFRIPTGLDALELLDLGLAIDGNEAAFTVSPYVDGDERLWGGPMTEQVRDTMTDALAIQQRALVRYLREKGFAPQFA